MAGNILCSHKKAVRNLPYYYYTRCAWAGGTCVSFPDFCDNCQFHVFTVFTLVYVLYFEEFLFHSSRGFMILKNI